MFGMLPFDRTDLNVFDSFDSCARDFFRRSNTDLPAFRTDIRDLGESYVLEAELPGFQKEDINLELKDGILTVSAQHDDTRETKDAQGGYIRRERRYGSVSRSFDVTGIEEGAITAKYENGVLSLDLPKAKPAQPETHRISIN